MSGKDFLSVVPFYLFIFTVIIAHSLTPTELQHYEGVKTSKWSPVKSDTQWSAMPPYSTERHPSAPHMRGEQLIMLRCATTDG